jgi:hypothetical protein
MELNPSVDFNPRYHQLYFRVTRVARQHSFNDVWFIKLRTYLYHRLT